MGSFLGDFDFDTPFDFFLETVLFLRGFGVAFRDRIFSEIARICWVILALPSSFEAS